jgi:hypothetical protein
VHVEYNHDSMLCGASVNHGSLANAGVGGFLANEKIASRSMVHSKAERRVYHGTSALAWLQEKR